MDYDSYKTYQEKSLLSIGDIDLILSTKFSSISV
jgi:hypothetical protein